MLLTGPDIPDKVRWQMKSFVSHNEMIESEPPVARYLAVGCSSTVRHEDVCPCSLNSLGSGP